jgi:methylmalonyl-CoA/ethylmalonyl-CoA epimerase
MLNRIGQIAIIVQDVERATAFYRDVMGLKFLFPAPGMAFFEVGGVWLMLTLPAEGFDKHASLLYFDVDDIDAEYQRMKGQGAKFRKEPHVVHRDGDRQLWLADFDDTEGNTYALRAWRQAA